jgi:predicted nucleotidyltransferase
MEEKRLNNIIKILVDEMNPERLILFGSRGKGISFPNSDYDIAVDTQRIEFRKKRILKDKIEDILGLHKLDLVFLNEVEKKFKEIILKTGKVIYER